MTLPTAGCTAFTRIRFSLLLLAAAALVLVGCDSPGGVSPDSPSRVSLAFSPASAGTLGAKSISVGDDQGATLTFDRVEIILSEIEFERDDDAECPDGREDDGSDDACEEIERGPILVDLPLDGQDPSVLIDTEISAGTWEEVEFEIDALDRDDDDEAAFLRETGFPEEVSIRATGTYTPAGETPVAFTYLTDLDAEKEIEFDPPLTVRDGETASVTFSVDIGTWFRGEDGRLLNPNDANDDGPAEDEVEDNIEASFDGFEDDDHDGRRDDDDDGDDGRDDDDDGDDGRDDDDDGDDGRDDDDDGDDGRDDDDDGDDGRDDDDGDDGRDDDGRDDDEDDDDDDDDDEDDDDDDDDDDD